MENYTFKLTQQQLAVISDGLSNLPYKHAAPIISDMNRQISEQETKSAKIEQQSKTE